MTAKLSTTNTDTRHAFVVETIACTLASAPEHKAAYASYLARDDSGAIAVFLDDPAVSLLQISAARAASGALSVRLSNAPGFPASCFFQLTLTKVRSGVVTLADIPGGILLSSVVTSPLKSLYHTLSSVYIPLLVGSGAENQHSRGGHGGVTLAAPEQASCGAEQPLDLQLQAMLESLQAGLASALRGADSLQGAGLSESAPLHGIISPLDELSFWREAANSTSAAPAATRAAAAHVLAALDPLQEPLRQLASASIPGGLEGALELVGKLGDALRQVWAVKQTGGGGAWAYPQRRMQHMLEVSGAVLAMYVQRQLAGLDVWTAPFGDLKPSLISSGQLLSAWVDEARTITADWAAGIDGNGHFWEGSAFAHPLCTALRERLDQIYALRELHEEITGMLSADEIAALGLGTLFAAFEALAPLHVSEFIVHAWEAAMGEYNRRLAPAEALVCRKLRSLLGGVIIPNLALAADQVLEHARDGGRGASSASSCVATCALVSAAAHPQQLLLELRQFRRLLCRPGVVDELHAEHHALAQQAERYLEGLQQALDAQQEASAAAASLRSGGRCLGASGCISWSMSCGAKALAVRAMVQLLLGVGPHHAPSSPPEVAPASAVAAALHDALACADALLAALKAHREELFKTWQTDVMDRLEGMAAWKTSRLMEVDTGSGRITCHFSQELMGLLSETRALQALGLPLRREVLEEMDVTARFHRYGLVLQQAAHFYNTVAADMIPSQKPLMLADAVELERMLLSPKDATGKEITWRSAAGLDGYVRRLSALAERLAMTNRALREWHEVLATKVVDLMRTSLVRNKDRWITGVKDIRRVFVTLEAQGYSAERQEVWRQHWDMQLYKALEVQFRAGLETINDSLPEIDVQLVCNSSRTLCYKPALEELRVNHISRLINGFLGLPGRMKGVSSLSEHRQGFFAPIADVYEGSEALFVALAEEARKHTEWLVLASIGENLEQHFDADLSGSDISADSADRSNDVNGTVVSNHSSSKDWELTDWQRNLESLCSARLELERLPALVRIGCYRVSLAPFKSTVHEHICRLQDAFGTLLHKQALADRQAILDFLEAGAAVLSVQAGSAEDVQRAGAEAHALVKRLGDVPRLRKRIEDKNKLLQQLAGGVSGSSSSSSSSRGGITFSRSLSLAPIHLVGLDDRWDVFVAQLQDFDGHLDAQRSRLQKQLAVRLEAFESSVAAFASRWQTIKPRTGPSGYNPGAVMAQLEDAKRHLIELQEDAAQLLKECDALDVQQPVLHCLNDVAADISDVATSWAVFRDFLAERDILAHREWLSTRDHVWKVEDFVAKWESSCSNSGGDVTTSGGQNGCGSSSSSSTGRVGAEHAPVATDQQAPRNAGQIAIAHVLTREIDAYRRCLPYLKTSMRGLGWEDGHWAQLFSMLGFRPGMLTKETVTLAHFLDKADAIAANAEAIRALDAAAQGESQIRKSLEELRAWSLQRSLVFAVPGQCSSSTASGQQQPVLQLVREWDEALVEVGNHQSLTANLKASPHHAVFRDEVASWETRLTLLSECLASLQAVQRRWLYLQPIFSRGALPGAAARFKHADTDFRVIMGHLAASRKLVALADVPNVLARLSAMTGQLDMCQRALSEFLEEKRLAFPRFYFLGDDDLLEILGQASDGSVIQAHLRKLFSGIHRVRFSGDKRRITAMQSADGEAVELDGAVQVSDAVESWMGELTKRMRSSLCCALAGVGRCADPFLQAPSQALELYHALSFTERVEAAISGGSLPALSTALRMELRELTGRQCTDAPLLQRRKQALIIDQLHACDVVDGLLGVTMTNTATTNTAQFATSTIPTSPSDWEWARQLRYYPHDGDVSVEMGEAALNYTWEYAGSSPKLVITPLTDRVFLTLTQALALGFGGNPYGPAGTGKTESVKALGQALGRQVLVFNCDEEFDVLAMGRIFIGLLRCGAWGCFDEFNRLSEAVLSAVSGQVQVIQAALREGARTLQFGGRLVPVDPGAAVFVTLNPAGHGYGGRSELPDNLKQMFRPIAMVAPDNELIAKVLLASEGFVEGHTLAVRLVSLFVAAADGLSSQQHYDWGLRALKACLGTAGRLLRQRNASSECGGRPGEGLCAASSSTTAATSASSKVVSESNILVQAVCDTKLPTLTPEDDARFRLLLSAAFPGALTSLAPSESSLKTGLHAAAAEFGISLSTLQMERALQLHLAMEQRIGVILVGPPGSGKSTLYQLLERALVSLGNATTVQRLNPKAMQRTALLGKLDLDTREWTDGVLTAAARQAACEPPERRAWIVCDGDVDPGWIEALNAVLDDNRLLTLPNGERIRFGANVNFIFECDNLTHASPATVSRCGVILTSEVFVEPAALLARWIKTTSAPSSTGSVERLAAADEQWLSQTLAHGLELYNANATAASSTCTASSTAAPTGPVPPVCRSAVIYNALSQLPVELGSRSELAAAIMRGLAAMLSPAARPGFYAQMQRLIGVDQMAADQFAVPASEDPLACLDSVLVAPAGHQALLPALPPPLPSGACASQQPEEHVLLLTDDTRALLRVLAPWLASGQPILLVGPEGCGKATVLDYALSRLPGNAPVSTVHCSAQTDTDAVLQALQLLCGRPVPCAGGRVLRPDAGRGVLYLKNINMPRPDKYGTVCALALVQQLLVHGGFHDAQGFVRVEGVQVIASMVPPLGGEGSRPQLPARLVAQMRIAVMGHLSADQLQAVYDHLLQRALAGRLRCARGAASAQTDVHMLSRCMTTVFHATADAVAAATAAIGGDRLQQQQQGLPALTTRHLAAWVDGLTRYDLTRVQLLDAFLAEGLAALGGALPDEACERQLEQLLLSTAQSCLGYQDGLPAELYCSLALPQNERAAAAAAGRAAPLSPWTLEQLGSMAVSLTKSLARENGEEPNDVLQFVPQALRRLVALDRCLSQPSGAVLLCAPAGSGRRCLSRLLAHAHGLRWWCPRVGMSFGFSHARAALKDVLRFAGLDGVPVLLYLDECHFADDPAVLELISTLLCCGEVPGLFTPDEVAKHSIVLDTARGGDTAYMGAPTARAYWLARLRCNLRVVLSMNPCAEGFAARLRSNPSLTCAATVLRWHGWSSNSLAAMLHKRMSMHLSKLGCIQSQQDELVTLLMHLHAMAASGVGAAPQRAFALADLHAAIAAKKAAVLVQQQQFLKCGLERLAGAAATVDALSQQARSQRTMLEMKQSEADTALVNIQTSMQEAAERRTEVERLRVQLSASEATLHAQHGDVAASLAHVQPLIDAARAAVGGIKADHIIEVRSLRMAPDVIRDVLEGVLLLMGQEDISWAAMRAFLGKRSVKEDIVNYDAHRILTTPGLRPKLERLLASKRSSFERDVAYRASQAAGPMAVWVTANLAYADVLKQVEPLEAQLAHLTSGLSESQARLEQCQEELQQLDGQVTQLKSDFQLRIREAESLKLELERAEAILATAAELLGKMSSERCRWVQQLTELEAHLQALPRAALAAAAFITYLVACPEDVRSSMLRQWARHLELPADFSPTRFLCTEEDQLGWQHSDLPSDELFHQNIAAVLHSQQTPLLIDPSSKAIEWLEVHLRAAADSATSVEVVELHSPAFTHSLELAVRFGKTLLVTEVVYLPPILLPLLRRDTEQQGGRPAVPVGERLVDASPTFRLLLATRCAAPVIPPDAAALLMIADFTMTRAGLEGQLLNMVLEHEQPELELRRRSLLLRQAQLKLELARLDRRLLQALVDSSGNLLEDKTLLESLSDAKSQASSVAATLAEGRDLAARLDEQRDAHRPIAIRGSRIYFALQALRRLEPMYAFGLPAFMHMFHTALGRAPPREECCVGGTAAGGIINAAALQQQQRCDDDDKSGVAAAVLAARNALLSDKLIETVHAAVGAAVLNEHRLALCLHLARAVVPEHFPDNEWAALLGCMLGGGSRGGGGGCGAGTTSSSTTTSSSSSSRSAAVGTVGTSAAATKQHPATAASSAPPGECCGNAAGQLSQLAQPHWLGPEQQAALEQLAAAVPDLVAAAQLHDASLWAGWAGLDSVQSSGGGAGAGGGSQLPAAAAAARGMELVPAPLAVRLTKMQQLLLVAALKPERFFTAAGHIVCQLLGVHSVDPPSLSMAETVLDTEYGGSCNTASIPSAVLQPILFITTPGADPSTELGDLAERQLGHGRLCELAMGQGQEDTALQLLRECARTGDWLLLKNLHLAVDWLPALERELYALQQKRSRNADSGGGGGGSIGGSGSSADGSWSPTFRVMLTSERHSRFPPGLLETARKVMLEAPPGIKRNLQRTYAAWGAAFIAGTPPTNVAGGSPATAAAMVATTLPMPRAVLRAQLLYQLAWLHALVQERRRYTPHGWSVPHDFSAADLRAAAEVVSQAAACSGPEGPDMRRLLGLLATVYGGRLDCAQDGQVLLAHLESAFDSGMLTALPGTASACASGRSYAPSRRPLPCSSSLQDWLAHIAALPEQEAPPQLGLPANIGRVVSLRSGHTLLTALRSLSTPKACSMLLDLRLAAGEALQALLRLWDQLLASAPPSLCQIAASSAAQKLLTLARAEVVAATAGTTAATTTSVSSAATAASLQAAGRQQPALPASTISRTDGTAAAAADITDPLSSFMVLERALATSLVGLVSHTMAGVRVVLSSSGGATAPHPADVQAAAAELLAGRVPGAWQAVWQAGPVTPGAFLRSAMRRAAALEGWAAAAAAAAGPGGGGLLMAFGSAASPLDLSVPLRPRALLSALHQAAALQARVPLGDISMMAAWDSSSNGLAAVARGSANDAALLEVHVTGIQVQGAALNGRTLVPALPETPLSAAAPVCRLVWLPRQIALHLHASSAPPSRALMAPLYASRDERGAARLLADLELPAAAAGSISHSWTLAGIALVLSA